MKFQIYPLFIILGFISCTHSKEIESQTEGIQEPKNIIDASANEETEKQDSIKKIATYSNTWLDSIAEQWNLLVHVQGGCLGGQQYVTNKQAPESREQLLFSSNQWQKFAANDPSELTYFLLSKLSDTSKTRAHTCPFLTASEGEMSIYALQHIHQKNWNDFPPFKEYKNREITGANDQPQVWLQEILADEKHRQVLRDGYIFEMTKNY
ncbi:hypothetical protein GYB22_12120 [bacterium]|nr:hypothetical protein [bacterium]